MYPTLLFAGFFFFAVTYNLVGPLAPDMMASTGMSLSESGSLMSFQQTVVTMENSRTSRK